MKRKNKYLYSLISTILSDLNVLVRVLESDAGAASEWSPWLIEPSESYVEVKGRGPIKVDTIEWLEINPVEERHIGRLVPLKKFDHTQEIIVRLAGFDIAFDLDSDGLIRLRPS